MVDIEKLRGLLARAKSKSDHPEDVASARYQLKEWSMSAALPALLDELERKTKALEEFCHSAECAAGCDEGCSEDDAYSEILSFAGSALAVSYAAARALLKGTPND